MKLVPSCRLSKLQYQIFYSTNPANYSPAIGKRKECLFLLYSGNWPISGRDRINFRFEVSGSFRVTISISQLLQVPDCCGLHSVTFVCERIFVLLEMCFAFVFSTGICAAMENESGCSMATAAKTYRIKNNLFRNFIIPIDIISYRDSL